MYDRLDKKKFSIVQKYEYDVKVIIAHVLLYEDNVVQKYDRVDTPLEIVRAGQYLNILYLNTVFKYIYFIYTLYLNTFFNFYLITVFKYF